MLHPSVNTVLDQKRSWQELSLLTNRDPLRHCLSLLDTLHWQGREAQLTTQGEVWTLSSNYALNLRLVFLLPLLRGISTLFHLCSKVASRWGLERDHPPLPAVLHPLQVLSEALQSLNLFLSPKAETD